MSERRGELYRQLGGFGCSTQRLVQLQRQAAWVFTARARAKK